MDKIIEGLLQQFESGKISRRQLAQVLATGAAASMVGAPASAAAPASKPLFKTLFLNHISYATTDYAPVRDFYTGILGMTTGAHSDNGTQCKMTFGQSFMLVRNSRQPVEKPVVNHLAFTIDNWDTKKVEAALKDRGFDPRPDTEDSFHVKDPAGYDVQICGPGMNPTSNGNS
jgi:catechol 2,3-dioxygenase-like lactoylglutathione lyase family enzyme